MTTDNLIGAVVAILLIGYVLTALLFPEKF